MLGAEPAPRYKVVGTKGTYVKHMAEYGSDPQAVLLNSGVRPGDKAWALDEPKNYGYIANGASKSPVPTVSGAYEAFYTQLADAIIDGKPQPVAAEETRDIIAAIEACFRSNEQGKRLYINEIGFLQPPQEG